MEDNVANKGKNQGHSRKSGPSAAVTETQPSKAPRQDEDGAQLHGSREYKPHDVDPASEEQGISNRPVRDEHAFPDTPDSREMDEGNDSVETPSKQVGG